jgi:hypothetical protein
MKCFECGNEEKFYTSYEDIDLVTYSNGRASDAYSVVRTETSTECAVDTCRSMNVGEN